MAKISRIRPPEEIPDSAMADVAFLLLVFFLATTTVAEEFGLTLVLPAPSNTPSEVNPENVMIITTDESGQIIYIDDQAQSLEVIAPLYKERFASNDKLVASVQPHRKAPYKVMVDILDELKLAGAKRISLKTQR